MTNERLKQAAELFYEKILQKKYAEATLRNYHQRIHSLLRYCDSKSLEAFSYDEAETYSYWLCERVDRGEIKDKYAGFLRNFALAFADFNSIPKLSDIDWENDRIHIVQHKTKRELVIPLLPAVGNAIADYILN